MTAHRYWRLAFISMTSSTDAFGLAEIEMRETQGGSDVTGSGTATANSNYLGNSGLPARLFDNNSTTVWSCVDAVPNPIWVQYDFGEGNARDINELVITARNDQYYTQAPSQFALMYSDDASTWTVAFVWSALSWSQGQAKTLNASNALSKWDGSTAKRYWRVSFDSSGSNYGSCAELEMRVTPGGADQTGSGTATAFATQSGSSPANAFDNNASTLWSSYTQPGDIHKERWLKYDFGAGASKAINEISWKARADGVAGYTTENPFAILICCSDDDSTWEWAWLEFDPSDWTAWSVGETRVFTKPVEETSISGNVRSSLPVIRDTARASLQRHRSVTVRDSLRVIADALMPPPEEARDLSGSLSDTLSLIADAITRIVNRTFNATSVDTLPVIRDAISWGLINLEKPVRWVAPMTVTPRVSTIDPLHLAAHPIRHPDRYYEPRVKSYGTFTRAISAPVGFIRTGDADISVLDADNSVRQRIASKTIRKAEAEIRLGPEGGKLSAFLRPFRRSIGTVSQGPDGELAFHCRDLCFDFLERKIPGLINDTNFAHLPNGSSDGFAPLVIGTVESAGGAVRCPHVDTVLHRYIVNRHPGITVTGVYRKAVDSDEFELVDSGEYSIVETVYLDNGEGGGDYCTLIQFATEQTGEIRANVVGLDLFGGLYMTNFADFLLGMFLYITWLTDRHDALNLASFEETRERVADLICAGALTQQMTYGELVSQIQRSSNIDVFADKMDRICIHYTTDDEEPTVDLDDTLRHYKGSVKQQLADPAYNRLPYRYGVNAAGKWIEDAYDNLADQEALGEIAEDEPLQMYWVRDSATALSVIEKRAQYLNLDSFRWESEIPLVPVLENLELADLVSISHFGGIKSGGYTGEQFKVLELGMDVDGLKYRVKGIRRKLPPPARVETEIAGSLGRNARPGPYYNGVEGELFGVFRNPHSYVGGTSLQVWRTTDYGATWAITDEANQPSPSAGIESYDVCAVGGVLHCGIQETTGRVSYHAFSMVTAKWILVDEQVLASVANGAERGVSIECRQPGGEPFLYFYGEREYVSGNYYNRAYYAIRSGGTWSTPLMATPDPAMFPHTAGWASAHCGMSRVVPGRENRMHMLYGISPGLLVGSKGSECSVTLREDLTFESPVLFWNFSLVFYPAALNTGGWTTSADRSILYRVWKGSFGEGHIDRFSEGPRLTNLQIWNDWITPWLGGNIFESFPGAQCPQGFLALDGDDLYYVHASTGPGYVALQKSTNHGAWSDMVKAGPQTSGWTLQHLYGDMVSIRERLYLTYFSGPDYPTFRWLRVDSLPYVE